MKDYIITSNGLIWHILNIEEHNYTRVKRGTIDRHLNGENLAEWLIYYKEYYITVKNSKEGFNRIFVLDEQDYIKEIL